MMRPYMAQFVLVKSDGLGMRPDSLREELEKRLRDSGAKMPRLLYINPTGGNPTGTVITQERREEVYGICQEYDLLILGELTVIF